MSSPTSTIHEEELVKASTNDLLQPQVQEPVYTQDNDPDITGQLEYFDRQYNELQSRVKDFIEWERPNTEHWPPWQAYKDSDYDPNRWEGEPRQYSFFLSNTLQELLNNQAISQSYLPYPEYNSEGWQQIWAGEYEACHGPRGEMYFRDADDYVIKGYRMDDSSLLPETIGSARALALDQSTCFSAESRLGAYGSKQDKHTKHRHGREDRVMVDWDKISWKELQDLCTKSNWNRYTPSARIPGRNKLDVKIQLVKDDPFKQGRNDARGKRYRPRTAILLRTWEGYDYKENDKQALRALITETSLLSGGEYQVFLLVNIKQRDADIYEDKKTHQDLLKKNVPKEFWDISILWTEKVLEEWYPKVGDWQVYWQQFMPLQWFSNQFPEYDYIWNWETDARYIGNHYHFLEQVSKFSRDRPRKHLWERNSRFFVPETWSDNYDAFLANTDEQILNASIASQIEPPVWGPRPYAPFQYPLGPVPPRSQEEDDFTWGVGEEADLITLQPIWDPSETQWSYKNHIWNFIPGVRPTFTSENPNHDGIDDPGFKTVPRRVFINTLARFSRKLLHAMHQENLAGRSMQAEMWPASVALHHGLKAVYAPHPIWTDRKWPDWYVEAVFNADDGIPARWAQQADSPYNHDREANFGGWTWYYRSVFSSLLYRRWLGWTGEDFGHDAAEAAKVEEKETRALADRLNLSLEELGKPQMCLPGMLLHPVKNVAEDAA